MSARARVLVTHWIHPEVLEELSGECDVVANRSMESLSRELLLERARKVQAILAFMPDRIDAAFLDQCPSLGIVAGAFKGVDNIDVGACTSRGVWVTVVPDLLTAPTAELALGLLLSVTRRLREGDEVVRGGRFQGWRPILFSPGISGRTVGLVGMGAVGQAIAARLAGFSCRLLYHDAQPLPPEREKDLRLEGMTLEALLAASDHVVLSLPLTPGTASLINDRALAGMKRGAGLVNVGRGSVVDELAIATALRDGRLGAYAADVFACEDLSRGDRPAGIPPELLAPDLRTMFTPHLGSAVGDTRLAISRSAARSILDALHGRPPAQAVNQPQPPRLAVASDIRPSMSARE
ncbi:MAG TPA: phosphonate dehydrogenase [Planctomycetota bacterium]|nr:phosphonate dehydrogenase [Planctomycetota bacterium]